MPSSKTRLLFIISTLLLCACQEPTEREKAIKTAKVLDDERALEVIYEVDKILDAPAPTQAEINTLVGNAIVNMVRIEGGEFTMGVSPERMGGTGKVGSRLMDVAKA